MNVHPKTVLITGCSSGIGRAAALSFLEEDWRVYATARNPADIETLGEKGCELATLDVTEQDDVDRVVDRIVEEEGHITCLVNNAGYGQFGPLEDVPTEQVHRQFDVNVYGPHRLTRAVLPHMRRQDEGTIVNVSSVAGRISFPGGGVYSGSKFALGAMTDALRNEVAEYGVDAVLVEPGPVATNFSERAAEQVEGTNEIPGIERSGAYESWYDIFEDSQVLGGAGPAAIPPERVAEDIVDAASSTKPRARYFPGTPARVAALARYLPDSWVDTAYSYLRKLA